MAAACPVEELRFISEGLFQFVCDIIGPECLVNLRRRKYDLFNLLTNLDPSRPYEVFNSGNRREGFDIQSSDYDIMEIDRTVLVLDGDSCQRSSTSDFPTILITETENISPGFTLLKCVKNGYDNEDINNSLVLRGENVFVSSRILIDSFMPFVANPTRIHGPCRSGSTFELEYDLAYTLRCPYWPEEARSFIQRSLRSGWPSRHTITSICKDGYLIVPISSKHQTYSDTNDLEWRMSFSLAEKELIYSFNHCQFLSYALMKLFLNEVLKKDPETGELLCSYFMKTAVFWEISESNNEWCVQNFLYKVWNVFRRVLKWVSLGYCPNFFIPEHNMFYGKIHGRQQRNLLLKLRSLYEKGYKCLLFNISLPLPHAIHVYKRALNDDNYLLLTTMEEQKVNLIILSLSSYLPYSANALVNALYPTAFLEATSEEVASLIKLRMNKILQSIAFEIYSRFCSCSDEMKSHIWNKYGYRYRANALHILRGTKTTLCINTIYYAICSYQSGNYYKTIRIINVMKQRLQTQPYLHELNLDGCFILHMRDQGMSYEEIMKKYVMNFVRFFPWFYIEELYLEVIAREKASLFIPPLVFLNFLLFLSLTRLEKTIYRYEVIFELYQLCHDSGYHVPRILKAICWEILGICQQLCGDHRGALRSYANALNDENNNFKIATMCRINYSRRVLEEERRVSSSQSRVGST